MKWEFQQLDKNLSYDIVETLVAVHTYKTSHEEAAHDFGPVVTDDSSEAHFVRAPLPGTLETFREAGWAFVEPDASLALAAAERSAVSGTSAVSQVVVNDSDQLMIATDRVAVKLADDFTEEEALRVLAEDGLTPLGRLKFAKNLFEARLPGGRPLPDIVSALQAKADRYEFVDPQLLQIIKGRIRPDDPGFAKQWQHDDGKGGGPDSADIRSEAAWDLTRGAGVRIAVIDQGMLISHPDLKDGIKGGGFFLENGTARADFVKLQPGMAGFPDNPHGTFCLGMAGARFNNGNSGCGSAPEADLIAIACSLKDVTAQAALARAVAYAVNPATEDDHATPVDGADVISCSLGPKGEAWHIQPVLDLAIKSAKGGRGGLGVPIFWAVDNNPVALSRDEVCSHPDVIAVSRSDRNNSGGDAAFGPKLDLLAPGVKVFSTLSGTAGDFGSRSGTSFAAPLAAGVAALVISRHPDFTPAEVRARLRQTCDQIGNVVYVNGHNNHFGFGRINAARAVQ